MPPSGYRIEQSSQIKGFLVSIAGDLKSEAEKANLQPIDALKKEIGNIEAIFSKNPSPLQKSVLDLTRAFYQKLLGLTIRSWEEYDAVVEQAADEAEQDILSIEGPNIS